jgi:hypothetical protein
MKVKPRTRLERSAIEHALRLCDQRRRIFESARKRLSALLPELSEQDVSDIANGVVLFDVNSIEVIEGDEKR